MNEREHARETEAGETRRNAAFVFGMLPIFAVVGAILLLVAALLPTGYSYLLFFLAAALGVAAGAMLLIRKRQSR
jgi:hypothetical protein